MSLKKWTTAIALAVTSVAGLSTPSSADPLGLVLARNQAQRCGVEVQVDPQSQAVDRAPATVKFRATVSVRKGCAGPVALSLNGLPGSASGVVSPSSVNFHAAHRVRTADVTVSLGRQTHSGSYHLWAIGRCGNETDAAGFDVVVRHSEQGGPDQQLGARPGEATVSPGDRAQFCVTGAHEPGELDVAGLPAHSSSAFSRTHGHDDGCIWLTVRTARDTPPGDYPLTITAGHPHEHGSAATVVLHVIGQAKPFTISGNLASPLDLGTPQPLDLTFTNPNGVPLTLINLSVGIDHLDAAHSAACPVADNFAVTQFTGPPPAVVIPAHGSTTLSTSGIDPRFWPQIELLNTDQNQDGCLGATLTLTYSGTAVG